jgi:hypothetical protein
VARSVTALSHSIQGFVKLPGRIVVMTNGQLRSAVIGSGFIGGWKVCAQVEGSCIVPWAGGVAIGTPQGGFLYSSRLEQNGKLAGRVMALASTGRTLAISDGRRLRLLEADGCSLVDAGTVNLPGISKLISVGETVFALASRQVWCLRDRNLTPTGVRADDIESLQGEYLLATRGNQILCIDPNGLVTMEYLESPWLTDVIQWSDAAVEINRTKGTLTLYDRFVTPVDLDRAVATLSELRVSPTTSIGGVTH